MISPPQSSCNKPKTFTQKDNSLEGKIQTDGGKGTGLKGMLWSNGIDRFTFDLGVRWSWLVKFMLRPFHSRSKIRYFPWNRRVGVPQSRRGRWGEEKTLLPLPRIEAQFLGSPARILVTMPTESDARTMFAVQDSWVLEMQQFPVTTAWKTKWWLCAGFNRTLHSLGEILVTSPSSGRALEGAVYIYFCCLLCRKVCSRIVTYNTLLCAWLNWSERN